MTMYSSMEIASQGLSSQSERLKVYANNIANMATPGYVRQIPVLMENETMPFETVIGGLRDGVIKAGVSMSPGGVDMVGYYNDPTPGRRIYEPGHPEADKDGYIVASNVNVLAEMSDAMATQRLYEANLAVVGIVKAMANRALEIGRGS